MYMYILDVSQWNHITVQSFMLTSAIVSVKTEEEEGGEDEQLV